MNKEDIIIEILEKQSVRFERMEKKLESHSDRFESIEQKLESHSDRFENIEEKLESHSGRFESIEYKLESHSDRFENMEQKLESHSDRFKNMEHKLENHSTQLTEHSQILKALLSGQEHLKAELDGFKISTGRAFEKLNEKVDTLTINHEVLRNDTHTNKVDIQRIKKTMGMA